MIKNLKKRKLKGFTLIELLIVVAIIGTTAIFTFPTSINFFQQNKAENVAQDIISRTFVQQQNAYIRNGNNSYGIAFFSNKYTIFTGISLASATATQDVILENGTTIQSTLLTSGSNEVVFQSGNIAPNQYGSIQVLTFQSVFVCEINQEGLLNFYKM